LLLCISTERATLAVPHSGIRQTKDAERRDKVERSSREGHVGLAGSVKTFRSVGDVKNDTADL
jgi:hypothetical protein